MYLRKDGWRGHIRFYDKDELVELYRRSGLRLLEHRYYVDRGWLEHAKWPFVKRAVIRAANALIPFYGENHFAVFVKD